MFLSFFSMASLSTKGLSFFKLFGEKLFYVERDLRRFEDSLVGSLGRRDV